MTIKQATFYLDRKRAERGREKKERERETRMLNAMNQQRGNTEIKQTAHFNDGMELFEWMCGLKKH